MSAINIYAQRNRAVIGVVPRLIPADTPARRGGRGPRAQAEEVVDVPDLLSPNILFDESPAGRVLALLNANMDKGFRKLSRRMEKLEDGKEVGGRDKKEL